MKAVMKEMHSIIGIINILKIDNSSQEFELFKKIKLALSKKEMLLEEQLKLVNKKIFSAQEVFDLNKKYDLKDN